MDCEVLEMLTLLHDVNVEKIKSPQDLERETLQFFKEELEKNTKFGKCIPFLAEVLQKGEMKIEGVWVIRTEWKFLIQNTPNGIYWQRKIEDIYNELKTIKEIEK